jgi:WD40 repeat protein/tRNA A-37 threonylcarbamoyl transferase component Bud32
MDSSPPSGSTERERRLDEAVAEYLLGSEAGRAPDPVQFLARYPDLAEELALFLDDRQAFGHLLEWTQDQPTGSFPRSPDACPHCHGRLKRRVKEAVCAGCGARFRLDRAVPEANPQQIGRFQVTGVAGRGAFGTVYKAWDPEMDRVVAVKVPRRGGLSDPHDTDRFVREARLALQLDHPNIVRVYEVGEEAGLPYLVSEFVAGRTLADHLRDLRPIPNRAAEILAAVADALEHAHRQGVVHRDVKPSNVLVRWDGIPLLTDFGLARQDSDEPTLTRDGDVLGTPAYMSPEQARGCREVDARSDVYSLGVVLYQLLTGQPPFTGNSRMVLKQILEDEPRPPRSLNDQLPRDLETICLECLRKEPARRYQTAADLAEDLRRFRQRQPILARPEGRGERLLRWGRRNPWLAAAGGVIAGLLVTATTVSVGWALDAHRQADALQQALDESQRLRAETELDRGLAEAERGNVGSGMQWMARSLGTAPKRQDDLIRSIRANLNAWRRQLVTLTQCVESPNGKVLAFSPDGRFAWFVERDGKTVRRWDLESARAVGPVLQHDEPRVTSIAVSPDGKWVACCGPALVSVWDAATGKPQPSPGPNVNVRGLTYSADGSLILAVRTKNEKNLNEIVIKVWDGKTLGPSLGNFSQAETTILMAATEGRSLLVANRAEKEFHRLDEGGGQLQRTTLRHPVTLRAVAVSPDRRRVLTGGEDQIAQLWDLASGRLLAVMQHRNPITAVGFSKDGRRILTASEDDAIRVWDRAEGQDGPPGELHPNRIRALAVNPQGDLVATGADDKMVRLWETTTGRLVLRGKPLPHGHQIQTVAFSPDGKVLAAGFVDGEGVELWNLADREKPPRHLPHKAAVHTVVFSPDGQLVATAGYANDVRVWNPLTGQPAGPGVLNHGRPVLSAAFSPDGTTLATGGVDQMARLRDVSTGGVRGQPLRHPGAVQSVAFHPTDPRIVLTAGDDGIARLWNTETGQVRSLFHGYPLMLARFTRDGNAVLTGGRDGRTQIWDTETGRERGPILRQSGRIWALEADPTGRWAVTASEDGTARLWDIRTGRPVGPAVRHDPRASCAVINPNGRWFVTAGSDKVARLQPAPAELAGPAERIKLWLQVATGAELDSRGEVRPLDRATWHQRRNALETLGGPPS